MKSVFNQFKEFRYIDKKLPICMAPWTSMSFNIDGTVAICCMNKKTIASIENNTIEEIWQSSQFNQLRDSIENQDLSYDCQFCLQQIANKNFTSVKARDYDKYAASKDSMPQIMEFCLENTCNLACDMCNTILSSTIRKNKGLPPLESKYGPEFVSQLDKFIPYLKEAVFVGGEPFLIPIYYDIWEKIQKINPNVVISVVTNGSVLNKRIKNLLEKGNFNINISIDSIIETEYEAIRINASFDRLLKNFSWFNQYALKRNRTLNIPICPLTINWKTIPKLVDFAIKENAHINFCYVEKPLSMALMHAETDLLRVIIETYKSYNFENKSNTRHDNITKFKELIRDIEKWLQNRKSLVVHDFESLRQRKLMSKESVNNKHEYNKVLDRLKPLFQDLDKKNYLFILNYLDELSMDRLYHIVVNKNETELKALINDLVK